MSLISKSRLTHPRLLTSYILIFGLLGCFTVINAMLNAGSLSEFLYPLMPLLFAAVLYTHFRYPTQFGWVAIALMLLVPAISEIIGGLTSIYFDMGTKYNWTTLINVLLMDIAILLAIVGIIYATKITETKP